MSEAALIKMKKPPSLINVKGVKFNEVTTRLGLILPSANMVSEKQFAALLPPSVAIHATRLRLSGGSEQDLLSMADHLEDAISLLLDAGVDLILFHCTGVSTFSIQLEEQIMARMRKASSVPVAITSQAIVDSLRSLDAKKLVLVSPFTEETNRREEIFLKHFGFEILESVGLGLTSGKAMTAVLPAEWESLALSQAHPDADAYLVSCCTIRATEVVEQLERRLGKPVVTSNTAAIWQCRRLLGISD